MSTTLLPEDRAFFEAEGYLLLKGFYDVEREIEPIQRGIYDIIGLVAQRHGVALQREAYTPATFDNGYNELIRVKRAFGAEVYDLVKQIPAFLRLISLQKSDDLFRDLRRTEQSGIGWCSYGIRIDNPNEDKFRSHWHQEFLYQPQSVDGIVFWAPLMPIMADMGPVIILPKSHKDGLCVYSRGGPYAHKEGAYQIGIHNADDVVSRYGQIAPLSAPGDLMIMDYLTVHSSGVNVSSRSRWSVQSRLFNYRDPVGMKIGWRASVTAGTSVEDIFAENFVES